MTGNEYAASAMHPLAAHSVGALLKGAREAAGLSQDAVAQQLKLAPRQVRAIEEDDYARLPGRTFVRGFVRNYARLVGLDPEAIAQALPRGESVSPLERLTYTPASRPLEMPVESNRRKSPARWVIPFLLLTVVAAAAIYEFTRQGNKPAAPPAQNVAAAPAGSPASSGDSTTTALPNPLEGAGSSAVPPLAAPEKADSGATAAAPAPVAAPATAAQAESGATSTASLVLTFDAASRVEVKDGTGKMIFLRTGRPGTVQTLAGVPPLDVQIDNAAGVALTFRGQPVNLAPYTRANIARLLLK
jgi:cytoskeleton protein RodZ